MPPRRRRVRLSGMEDDPRPRPQRSPVPNEDYSDTLRTVFILLTGLLGLLAVVAYNSQRVISIFTTLHGTKATEQLKWWQTSVIYQVYPRSFMDSNGDGIGDLQGIISKLDHFKYIHVGAIWLSPFYKSPMVDFGYDVSNYREVDPMFGTMDDFDKLIQDANSRGLRVILDIIPNHTSDQHLWFEQSSSSKTGTYADYYVWHDGIMGEDGKRHPPNNWVSVFGGPMWTWHEGRQQFYLHQFTKEQPDLNFRNPQIRKEIMEVFAFWLEKGVDGFRVDAVRHLFESEDLLLDEPLSYLENTTEDQYEHYQHPLTVNLKECHEVISSWRQMFSTYEEKLNKDIFMVVEVFGDDVNDQIPYYESGADMPFNFNLLSMNRKCGGSCVHVLVSNWLNALPEGKWPNWVTGNHDNKRISHKMRPRFVNAMNMLLLLLPGTPTTYYGEEIGMRPVKLSFMQTQDPHGRHFGPERYEEFSRDPSRSPMQWSTEAHAGFTKASKPWLPVHPNYTTINVQRQMKNSNSPLSLYRRLAKLRSTESFVYGKFDTAIINQNIYSFLRWQEGQPCFLIAINFGKEPSTDNYRHYTGQFFIESHSHFVPKQGSVVLNTQNFEHSKGIYDMGQIVRMSKVTLRPGEGLVIEFWPGGH